MTPSDTSSVKAADELFLALGTVATALQTYTENHPRLKEPLENAMSLLGEIFSQNREVRHVSYIVNGSTLEFRGVPINTTTTHADRLFKALKSRQLGGLQIERGITAEEVLELLNAVGFLPSRSFRADETCKPASARSQSGGKPRFHLATTAEVDELRRSLSAKGTASFVQPPVLPELSVFEGTARSLLKTYRAILSKPEEVLRSNQGLLRNTIDRVSAIVGPHREKLISGVSGGYFDDFTYHHSVNVCLITGLVAGTVVRNQQALSRISLAALLHDVGKSRIPVEVLHKPGRLTPAEAKLVEQHPTYGAEILLGIEGLDPLCAVVAFAHHKIYGRRPYPATLLPFPCDWVTRLISVVDIYEALTAARPYKRGMSTDAAFRVMLSMPGIEADSALVRLLYAALGPFPVGSTVELSTGERGVILALNASQPRLPRVRVLTDPSRQRLLCPIDLDLANVADSSLAGKPRTIARAIVRHSASQSLLTDDIEPDPTDCLGAPIKGNDTFTAREA